MNSYNELAPFILGAFANVVKRDHNLVFTSLLITLDGAKGSISINRAISYVVEWHGANLINLVSSILIEAESLREKANG
jgi:hypothetical protein